MPFVKVVKNRVYFKRYQTKYRRRREGKTDYQARTRLINQDKNKYNTPKYRFIVRITNRNAICQIAYSKANGDYVMGAAYSNELWKDYGMKPVGLTNYAACYATGLLCGRRVLNKLGLDTQYQGQPAKKLGALYEIKEAEEGPRPFKAFLDVGLARTVTGARVFAALKGAVDAGVDIPHSETRFIGYDTEKGKFDPKKLRSAIVGGKVAAYMKELKKNDEEKYKAYFGTYIKNGVEAGDLEKMYLAVHEAIRKNPAHQKKEKKLPAVKRVRKHKMSLAQRRDKLKMRLDVIEKKMQA